MAPYMPTLLCPHQIQRGSLFLLYVFSFFVTSVLSSQLARRGRLPPVMFSALCHPGPVLGWEQVFNQHCETFLSLPCKNSQNYLIGLLLTSLLFFLNFCLKWNQQISQWFLKENKHTWNSDNKRLQIHSSKQQWLLVVVAGYLSLQMSIDYLEPLQSSFPETHHISTDSGKRHQWESKTKGKGCWTMTHRLTDGQLHLPREEIQKSPSSWSSTLHLCSILTKRGSTWL